ncbi:hypothetical protein HPB48_016479 [Haemaphysalis longicornis]|uniref:Uncharacterized protein n=1 Tax=Haemaphysalis longicornis TaxID=44386 RepID=A0A9J6GCQ7_HAELO|nr:hypothetical protein HPB48_016479 [Haemaphysalis longicornis]
MCVFISKGLQIWLKSDKGEIEVYLSNPEDRMDSSSASTSGSSEADTLAAILPSTSSHEELSLSAGPSQGRDADLSARLGQGRGALTPASVLGWPQIGRSTLCARSTHSDFLIPNRPTEIPIHFASYTNARQTKTIAPSTDTKAGAAMAGGELCLKRALISEEDDLAPMGGRQLLLQTEDQLLADGFVQLEPPLSEEDYAFTLDQAEGIADLFDDYDFSDLCPTK